MGHSPHSPCRGHSKSASTRTHQHVERGALRQGFSADDGGEANFGFRREYTVQKRTLPSPPRPSSQMPLLLWPMHVSVHVVKFTRVCSQGKRAKGGAVCFLGSGLPSAECSRHRAWMPDSVPCSSKLHAQRPQHQPYCHKLVNGRKCMKEAIVGLSFSASIT